MPNTTIAAEPIIRLTCFRGIPLLMALWEFLTPRRPQVITRRLRWPNNLGLVVLDTLVVRLLFPFAAVGLAFVAQTKGWGLFNIVRFRLARNPGRGASARSGDLRPARGVPCRAAPVATASYASRGPGVRCYDGLRYLSG